jgi:hypothetical protein
MSAWQAQRGHEPTGVLSARQRAELLGEFNAILTSLGMETVRDAEAGIQIDLPMGVLGAPVTEPPFVRYDGRDGVPPQVVLISQPGDASRLAGLYEIMQTLEIVPEEGPRERREDAFVIEGQDGASIRPPMPGSWTGQIKGFSLVWPAGDDDRRGRLVEAMRASFRRLPGCLILPRAIRARTRRWTSCRGSRIRKPQGTAPGFFVDSAGTW